MTSAVSAAAVARDVGQLLAGPAPPPALTSLSVAQCGRALSCLRKDGRLLGPLAAQLERLDLTSGGLAAAGVTSLVLVLPQMARLRALLLGDNGMGPQGAMALAAGLSHVRETLEELDLSGNGLGSEGLDCSSPSPDTW